MVNGSCLLNPSHEKNKGRLKVISLTLIKPVPRKIKNNRRLDFILISIRLIMEQTERKCKIPKKIKLLLSKIKVSIEMAIEIVINLNMRFTILDLRLFDGLSSLDDIPAIVIKLKPISCAKNSPNPCVTARISINPK